ncbi:MAG: nitroreductase family protein [Actinomycetota bacterium]|nr:nitroreductase family protein [Actinomycetota bacterium]
MEFTEILRKRRMVRSFDDRPVPAPIVDRILSAGLRAPSAGFTQAVDLVVLAGRAETARYWDATLPASERASFPWPGLLRAPLLVLVVSSEDAYRRRYAEPDKGRAGVDVPWWYVDGAFTALLLQLAAVDSGLGALFFRSHRVPDLRRVFHIPETHVPVGTVAVGHPAADDRPSSSVGGRRRRTAEEIVHRGSWGHR